MADNNRECIHVWIFLHAYEAWRGNSLANFACLLAIYSSRSSAEAAMTMNCMTRDKMISLTATVMAGEPNTKQMVSHS